ncbi:MAG: hypothetical protein HZB13_15420 [Acidobacteria bacterium]|nr:hypothetical protein [Acidobacteriota bacterium]
MTRSSWLTVLFLGAALPLAGGLPEIRQEPDPLRRFDMALDHAGQQMKLARELVKEGGSRTELLQSLDEIAQAAGLALESLRSTGKRPAKLSRQYKKGELRTREMEKQLSELVRALSLDDRPAAEKTRERISTTHEEFLLGVMTGK